MTGKEMLSAYMAQLSSSWIRDKYEVAFALIHTIGNNPTVNGSYVTDILDDAPRFFIPDSEKRVCRFCGRRKPEVSFKKKAHAVSEFLGNKMILSDNECDTCNARFSDFENHLAYYLQPYNTIFGVQGKNGSPMSKTKDKTSWISTKPSDGLPTFDPSQHHGVYGKQEKSGKQIFTPDEEKKTMHVSIERPSYSRSLAFKALVKIALSLLPSKYLIAFPEACEWLNSSTRSFVSPMFINETLYSGEYNLFEHLHLYGFIKSRPESDIPFYHLMICYGNMALQFYVPSALEIQRNKAYQQRLPTPLDAIYKPIWKKTEDFSSPDMVRDEVFEMDFQYEIHEMFIKHSEVIQHD